MFWLIHISVRKINQQRRRVVNVGVLTLFLCWSCVFGRNTVLWQTLSETMFPCVGWHSGSGLHRKMEHSLTKPFHPFSFWKAFLGFSMTNDFYGIILNVINTRLSFGRCAAYLQSCACRKSPFRACNANPGSSSIKSVANNIGFWWFLWKVIQRMFSQEQ